MSRRPFTLIALSLVALAAACSDATAPASTPAPRQIQPSGQAAQDVTDPDVCRNGTMSSTGKAC